MVRKILPFINPLIYQKDLISYYKDKFNYLRLEIHWNLKKNVTIDKQNFYAHLPVDPPEGMEKRTPSKKLIITTTDSLNSSGKKFPLSGEVDVTENIKKILSERYSCGLTLTHIWRWRPLTRTALR